MPSMLLMHYSFLSCCYDYDSIIHLNYELTMTWKKPKCERDMRKPADADPQILFSFSLYLRSFSLNITFERVIYCICWTYCKATCQFVTYLFFFIIIFLLCLTSFSNNNWWLLFWNTFYRKRHPRVAYLAVCVVVVKNMDVSQIIDPVHHET